MINRIATVALVLLLAACTPLSYASRDTQSSSPEAPTAAILTPPVAHIERVATPASAPGAPPDSAAPGGTGSAAVVTAPAPAALATVVASAGARARELVSGLPAFGHVFIIVLENKESSGVLGSADAPYINELAKQYAYAGNYFGISHPSLPNYLALTGGGTFAITSDCVTCFVAADNIANQMEKAGRSWKAYIESMPSPCYQGPDTDLYAQRHNPFIYFNDIRNNHERCQKIVPFGQFQVDLAAGALPQYVWISPNLCNDMHDCPVSTGDAWLKTWVPQILASKTWQDNGVLFITFDEGTTTAGCCQYATGGKVSMLVVSPLVKKGFVSDIAYDHYSLLRTIEQAWGLPLLDHTACDCSLPMSDFFTTTP